MVYVRKAGEDAARACEILDLAAEGGSVAAAADTLIAVGPAGPFEPLARALERGGALRDAFARALPVPSLGAWQRVKWLVLALATLPLLMLLELDRELVSKDLAGPGRLVLDGLAAVWIAFELTRRTPRAPRIAAAALLAVAMRWTLVVTRLCGRNVHAAVWVAGALALAAGLVTLGRAPTTARVALELLAKLGISRSEANAAMRPAPVPTPLVVGAGLAAVGLPLLMWALRRGGLGLGAQAGAFVAYAILVPEIVRRVARAPREADSSIQVLRTIAAIFAGLTLTAALLHGTHHFFDAGGELARCTHRLDEATRRLLGAEAAELARRVASVRSQIALVLMTTCVMPLAEERIYRGLLMNVLVRRYGSIYGLFVSAAVFGFAHVGIYEIALYQTVLLGIGFGVAYAEGGIVAAFVVHAAWNLLNVA